MKSRDAICDELGKLGVSFPRAWQEEGRVAVPRLIFAFHRNPLRADLGAVKRVSTFAARKIVRSGIKSRQSSELSDSERFLVGALP